MDKTALRRMRAFPFLFLTMAALLTAQQTNRKDSAEAAKAEVLQASGEFDKARAAKDKAALERILAEGLAWTARGERLNKAQLIADILAENLHFKYFAHDNVSVRVFENTAVITGHSTSVLEYKGKLYDAPRLFTDVWVRMDGRWQLVVHHVSDLAKT